MQNALIESFDGKFCDEGLNQYWFGTRQGAQRVIEAWRKEYNEERTHRSLGDLILQEFSNTYQDGAHLAQESTSLAVV